MTVVPHPAEGVVDLIVVDVFVWFGVEEREIALLFDSVWSCRRDGSSLSSLKLNQRRSVKVLSLRYFISSFFFNGTTTTNRDRASNRI